MHSLLNSIKYFIFINSRRNYYMLKNRSVDWTYLLKFKLNVVVFIENFTQFKRKAQKKYFSLF